MKPADRLIVALDHPTGAAALAQVDALGAEALWYKVGLELYCAAGDEVVRTLLGRGKRVFLDLKLHDIPETVGRTSETLAALGVHMMTIHAAGGAEMMKRAAAGAKAKGAGPAVLGVTVLTSLDQRDLVADGYEQRVEELVVARALAAKAAGLDGVIASPMELPLLRGSLPESFLIVTPGIRPVQSKDDQKRSASAKEARAAGASAIVVGRPIRDAVDPRAVVRQLLAELA